MFYAIHSTLNGIIPLLTARIKGLMAFGDLYLALIPVHEDSLEQIDKKNRKLFVNLPEGLLDIYRDA